MTETIYWEQRDSIMRLVDVLQKGNVVLSESDTVLGLFAPITQEGFNALNRVKGRFEKPYLVLVSSAIQAREYVVIPQSIQIEKLMEECWPGPLTLVFTAKDEAPAYLKSSDNTIAVRVPRHEYLLPLLDEVGPLFSTSANQVGHELPESWDEVDPKILEKVSFVVRSNSYDVLSGLPSTILDCRKQKIRVVRQGAYSLEELKNLLGSDLLIS